jgi:hypothetical protein
VLTQGLRERLGITGAAEADVRARLVAMTDDELKAVLPPRERPNPKVGNPSLPALPILNGV